MLQSWVPVRDYYFALNGVSWYLSTAMFTYFCYPYIRMIFIKMTKGKCIALLSLAILTSIGVSLGLCYFDVNEELTYYITYINPAVRLIDFIVGCATGWLFANSKAEEPKKESGTFCEIVILCLLVFCELVFIYTDIPSCVKYQFLFLLISPFVVWTFAQGNGLVSNFFASKKLILWLTTVSGPVFLIHHKIIGTFLIVSKYVSLSKVVIAAVSFAMSCAFAVAYNQVYKRVKERRQL